MMSDYHAEPTLVQLLHELDKFNEWDRLGLELGLDKADLEKIEKEQRGKVDSSKREMINLWFRSNKSCSWDQVAVALEWMKEERLASNIRRKYLSADPAPEMAKGTVRKRLSSSDKFARSLGDVEEKFLELVITIETALEEAEVPIRQLVRCCMISLNSEGRGSPAKAPGTNRLKQELKEVKDVAELFDIIQNHFCFLNYSLLERIVNMFLKDRTTVNKLMHEYQDQLEIFKTSTELQDLTKDIEQAHLSPPVSPAADTVSTCSTGGMCRVVLTLVGSWLPNSVKNVESLMKEIFQEKQSVLTHLKVVRGSVIISYLAPEFEADFLIAKANESKYILLLLGVQKLCIGDNLVFCETSNFSFQESLLKAVESNDTHIVLFLAELKQFDPDFLHDPSSESERSTPASSLFIASQLGFCIIIDILLKHGANVNTLTGDGRTPLMAASKYGHVEAVGMLLSGGASLEILDEDGDTALRYANDNNQTQVVELLLKSGANPSVVGTDKWSCLLVSCCDNNYEIVPLLLKYGADRHHTSSLGKTCLMMASESGHLESMRIMLNNASPAEINQTMKGGWCALSLAYDHPEAVELLLTHGADPNVYLEDGWSTLMLACEKNIPGTVNILLRDSRTKYNYMTKSGVTAYGIAEQKNYDDIKQTLKKAGVKPKSLLKTLVHLLIPSKSKYAQLEVRKKLPLTKKLAEVSTKALAQAVR